MRAALIIAVVIAGLGCGRSEAPRKSVAAAPEAKAAAPAPRQRTSLAARAPGASSAPRLSEDPVAGKRSTAQWLAHQEEEDLKRQLVFDRDRMPAHRALLAQLRSARTRYDRARTEAALASARTAMPAQLAKIQVGVEKLDPQGTGSGVLDDYAALQAALASSYPDAKLASLRGDASALTAAQASFDQRLHEVHAWLERAEVAKGEGEYEDESEEEKEREREGRHERL